MFAQFPSQNLLSWMARGIEQRKPARSTVGRRFTDIKDSSMNIVHMRRGQTLDEQQYLPMLQVLRRHPIHVVLSTARNHAAAQLEQLFAARGAGLYAMAAAGVQEDILTASDLLREELGWDRINIRLTAVDDVTCPKWHADYVGLRLLCTYCGAGTLYVTDDYVTRGMDHSRGLATVEAVQERWGVMQAGPGDWLLLKGHRFPGNFGLGAVHRSPPAPADGSQSGRLLLVIDDDVRDSLRECC